MLKLSELHDKHQGRPGAVLGGGPSLPEDLKRLPADCILIAVNYHAFHHCQPDYMVYLDDPHEIPEMLPILNNGQTNVSPEFGSHVEMDVNYWRYCFSSTTAAWLGLWLGCHPVILCGMDMYRGNQMYCHPTPRHVPAFDMSFDNVMRPWIEEARARCPHPERLRAASGPLMSLFPAYVHA
jgi:hypothetical protein